MYYLMIKEIEQTGMKYLCKRKKYNKPDDHLKYAGSGKLWNRILKAHPNYTIKTTVLGLYDKDDLIKYGLYYSNLFNVVESTEWANLIPEIGDGGPTNTGKRLFKNTVTGEFTYDFECPKNHVPYGIPQKPCRIIHNPTTGKMRKISPDSILPEGWKEGGIKGKYSYGPKKGKTKVYNNGKRKIYIEEGNPIPEGYVAGLHYTGTTKNRIGCYNPYTLEKRYVVHETDIPTGFVKGLPPTTGKKIHTPHGIFNSVAECMSNIKLTRYQILCNIKNKSNWFYIKD